LKEYFSIWGQILTKSRNMSREITSQRYIQETRDLSN